MKSSCLGKFRRILNKRISTFFGAKRNPNEWVTHGMIKAMWVTHGMIKTMWVTHGMSKAMCQAHRNEADESGWRLSGKEKSPAGLSNGKKQREERKEIEKQREERKRERERGRKKKTIVLPLISGVPTVETHRAKN